MTLLDQPLSPVAGTQPSKVGPPSHLPWLDWLRFLAAMAVFLTHLRTATFVEYAALAPGSKTKLAAGLFAVTRIGNEAVIVFFVLSGYLIAGRTLERVAAGQFRATDYIIDRLARIYTPYLPALALVVSPPYAWQISRTSVT